MLDFGLMYANCNHVDQNSKWWGWLNLKFIITFSCIKSFDRQSIAKKWLSDRIGTFQVTIVLDPNNPWLIAFSKTVLPFFVTKTYKKYF